MPHRLVIIGNGMAGARLAEHIVERQGRRRFHIEMFGDEEGGSYNRVLLSGLLAGHHLADDIVTTPLEWYASHGVVLHSGVRAVSIDLRERIVVDARGCRQPFDSLVLATGSRPVVPPIEGLTDSEGNLRPGAFAFRTLEDCAAMAAAAAAARHAVVIGGGLLGIEAARGLLAHGAQVTVVHLVSHVMDAQLDPPGGLTLQRQLEQLGLSVLAGRTTTRVVGDASIEAIELSDGTRLPCDLLVVAAGVRPDVDLARVGGLVTRRGIVVGDDLSCPGVEGIYAIGDCAEHRERVYGLVAPAWEQADVLADRLTGRRPAARYRGTKLATKLKVAGLDVAVMGERDAATGDEVVSYAEPTRGIYSKVIVRDDRITGAILVGMPVATASMVQRFLDGSPIPAQRSDLLFPPSGASGAISVEQIADAARICDCNAVTKAALVDAVLSGARSMRAVCEKTRAGTGCGSCKPEIQRIVDFVCSHPQDIAAPGVSSSDAAAGGGRAHASA